MDSKTLRWLWLQSKCLSACWSDIQGTGSGSRSHQRRSRQRPTTNGHIDGWLGRRPQHLPYWTGKVTETCRLRCPHPPGTRRGRDSGTRCLATVYLYNMCIANISYTMVYGSCYYLNNGTKIRYSEDLKSSVLWTLFLTHESLMYYKSPIDALFL